MDLRVFGRPDVMKLVEILKECIDSETSMGSERSQNLPHGVTNVVRSWEF